MKKSQLKIQQMAFMIIAITILVVLVVLFYLSLTMQNLKNKADTLKQDQAREMALKAAGYAEFTCGINCVDLDKAMALKGIVKYKEFIKNTIKIIKLTGKVECNIANYPNCDIITINEKSKPGLGSSSFVALCRKDLNGDENQNKCELGKIVVFSEQDKK